MPLQEPWPGDARRVKDLNQSQPQVDLSEAAVIKALAESQGLEFIPNFNPTMIDTSAHNILDEERAEKYGAIALGVKGDELTIVTYDPNNISLTDDLPRLLGFSRIIVKVATKEDFMLCFEKVYSAIEGRIRAIEQANQTSPPAEHHVRPMDLTDKDDTSMPGNVLIVRTLLRHAIERRASDISIEPGAGSVLLRLRIDGLYRDMEPPSEPGWHKGIVSFIKTAGGMDITENRRPLDGSMAVRHHQTDYDIRIATMPTVWGEQVTMRILNPNDASKTFAQIGFDQSEIEVLESQIQQPNGVILVTGPTGSGKTTTLYACLARLNSEDRKILTIEDPVEYRVDRMNQTSINEKVGMDFSTALKASLRQAPNVILIGEMRDAETASIAMKAALTGHLVFSTLHTNDAAKSIARLVDMGVPRFVIADSVRAIIAQRLVRRLCTRCSRPSQPSMELMQKFVSGEASQGNFKIAQGCSMCNEGYTGRIAITEVMVCVEAISQAIVAGLPSSVLHDLACEAGMIPLKESGYCKALAGLTTLEEVLKATAV